MWISSFYYAPDPDTRSYPFLIFTPPQMCWKVRGDINDDPPDYPVIIMPVSDYPASLNKVLGMEIRGWEFRYVDWEQETDRQRAGRMLLMDFLNSRIRNPRPD